MASQTSALPDGSTLTKPAYTDSADIAVINTNMDKIVSNINAENQAISTINQVLTSDWTGASAYKEQIEASSYPVLQIFGKVRSLSFQGVSREHTEDEVLMTLPSEHRPIGGNAIFTVGSIGATPVIIRLNGNNGQITVYVANNAGAGRIYFNMTWVVA